MTTVPTSGTSVGREARRLMLLDKARDVFGSARALGEVIGVGRRNVNHKLNADRRVSDFELKLIADAIEAKARELDRLVADIRKVIA